MIGKYVELTSFDKMAKMFDGQIDCEELTVERAVSRLWRS